MGEIRIRYAEATDFEWLREKDRHIRADELAASIEKRRVPVMLCEGNPIGWLRYNLFWDNTPFLNMLYFSEDFRGKGYGTQLIRFWERDMAAQGYERVLTSTLSDERAQFFYRKNGYVDCGVLFLPGEAAELLFRKELNNE